MDLVQPLRARHRASERARTAAAAAAAAPGKIYSEDRYNCVMTMNLSRGDGGVSLSLCLCIDSRRVCRREWGYIRMRKKERVAAAAASHR